MRKDVDTIHDLTKGEIFIAERSIFYTTCYHRCDVQLLLLSIIQLQLTGCVGAKCNLSRINRTVGN